MDARPTIIALSCRLGLQATPFTFERIAVCELYFPPLNHGEPRGL